MEPPRVTAQQKQVTYANGRPRFYAPERLREAQNAYLNAVWPYRPKEPITGPVVLFVTFCFSTKTKKKWNTAKITRPDTDNLIKAFKDVLTAAGYWNDDAQVFRESITKKWSERGSIEVLILDEKSAQKDAEELRRRIDKIEK